MAEIKTKVKTLEAGEQHTATSQCFVITEDHTIADIARFLVEEDYLEEIVYMFNNDKL